MSKNSLNIWETSLLIALCLCLCQAAAESGRQAERSEKLLRLHVVAASDSAGDQALKLRVRDAVAPLLEEVLADCENLSEAEMRIEAAREAILSAASSAAEGEQVEMSLGRELFSRREAEGYALPAGEYSALRLVIGSGQGRNWGGVIFPALDLSGGSTAVLEYLSAEELRLIRDGEGVEVRFRFLELWQEIAARLREHGAHR